MPSFPSNFMFRDPALAAQQVESEKVAILSRAQELADRNALLENIRLSQDSARQSGDRRYQTDAYRSSTEGQNQIGMANAETLRSQGARRLDLDTVIAENNRRFDQDKNQIGMANAETLRSQGARRLDLDTVIAENNRRFDQDQLATQKAIAEINANAAKLRPQDVAAIGKTVELHNAEADDFNNTAPNAALIIKNLADELRKKDSENFLNKEIGFFTRDSVAKKNADAKLAEVPYSSYIAKALAASPTLVPYVRLDGDKVSARMKKRVTLDSSGRLVEIDPIATQLSPAPAPAPQASWQSRMADSMSAGQAQPAQQPFRGASDDTLMQFGGGNPAALIQELSNPAPQISGGMGAPATLTNKATGKRFTVTPLR